MYSRPFAEMFPSESLDQMWMCENLACFYQDALFQPSELEWYERWSKVEHCLVPQPRCPSCGQWMEVYNDGEV